MKKVQKAEVSDTTGDKCWCKAGQQKNPASKTKQDFLKCQRNIFKK